MAIAVPQFYVEVVSIINLMLFLLILVLEIVAFALCAMQRSDAFSAIGTFSKGAWLAILGGCVLFTLLGLAQLFGVLSAMINMIPIIVILVFLLDVRPALRDVAGGRGSW